MMCKFEKEALLSKKRELDIEFNKIHRMFQNIRNTNDAHEYLLVLLDKLKADCELGYFPNII